MTSRKGSIFQFLSYTLFLLFSPSLVNPTCSVYAFQPFQSPVSSKRILQRRQKLWIESTTFYISTLMREEARRARGQLPTLASRKLSHRKKSFDFAKRLYFARSKIKSNKLDHAEIIYRKLIRIMAEEVESGHTCDRSELAISTLLLALLLQRTEQIKETRAAFLRFFRIIQAQRLFVFENDQIQECTCSAKVLQAYALFEMKQGLTKKAYYLADLAIHLDAELKPLLNWKQFREARESLC